MRATLTGLTKKTLPEVFFSPTQPALIKPRKAKNIDPACEPFCRGLILIDYIKMIKEGNTMTHQERIKITALDIYRSTILGLMGLFYGFLVFLMFL